MQVRRFRDLLAWQRAMELAELIYEISAKFPNAERFGLTDQLRRAAVSVPSNIAEGHDRNSTREFVHFLSIARGSLAEVETQLELADRLKFRDSEVFGPAYPLIDQVGRLISGLSKSLRQRDS